ncbi:MAG TPA: hypothetical protein PK733_17950, partial [Clostridiales bacterium]|nr:hypothetical protein [Clostridiales bacterium]
MPVKDNQANLHKDIKLEMDTIIAEQQLEASAAKEYAEKGIKIEMPFTDMLGIHQEFDKGHSRIERRTYYVLNDASCVLKDEWPDVAALAWLSG